MHLRLNMDDSKYMILKRGDVVKYDGQFYFFQPNGTSSYLYRYYEEIGSKGRAARRPPRWNVVKASPKEAEAYRRTHLKVLDPSRRKLKVPQEAPPPEIVSDDVVETNTSDQPREDI